ncbi:MAG: DUF3098 domain-containing protein [Bacteroidetes bacterium]|nr:DUF3098 domain-containing protein [Bacteroidota bacterium]
MKTQSNPEEREILFDRRKYYILIAGILVGALGFILMIGGGTEDPNEFSYDIFSHRRITLAPILVLAGYGIMIYSILTKKKSVSNSDK